MPNLSDILLYALGALAVVGAAWFALGSSWNLRRGNEVLRWLRQSLPALGERTTLQWLGTSAVKLTIAQAKDPFKDLEVVIVMEPRDVPLLWLYGHLNGRRDTLIFRGHLRQPPRPEIELASTRLWTGREALGEVDRKAWLPVTLRQAQDAGGADAGAPSTQPYVAMSNGAQGQDLLNEWFARSTRLAPGLARISVRRGAQYQLQWHSSIPDLKSVSSSEIIHLVRQIGRQASQ